MRLWVKILLAVLAVLVVGPFLVPVPPVAGTVPPRELADADSMFTVVNGIDVHYKTAGEGEPALVLLHGFGASVFSWRDVLEPLAQDRLVVAFDRPAFGLTERPTRWFGVNPYSMASQVDLTIGLMDELGIEKAILVGHSAGGAVAVETALANPARIAGLVLVAPALDGFGPGAVTQAMLSLPQVNRLGPLFVRSIATRGVDAVRMAWHDQNTLTEAVLAGYQKPLRARNWDRALWDYTRAARASNLQGSLSELAMPVTVITGDEDRLVPPEQSRAAAQALGVDAVLLEACGHLPHEEYPEQFIATVREFLETTE